MYAFRLVLISALFAAVVIAGTLTQISPFTQPGVTVVITNLHPQTAPLAPPGAAAYTDFNAGDAPGLDLTTMTTSYSRLGSAQLTTTWQQHPTAFASASSQYGVLETYAQVTAAPFTGAELQAHAEAIYQDILTVYGLGIPYGTPGFLDITMTVTGLFTCDSTPTCPNGVEFGYGPGTLGITTPVHRMGGEDPTPGSFSTTQMLVPLPMLYGVPFNVNLEMGTTARVLQNTSTGQFINTYNTSDLAHTLRVTGVSVTDAAGDSLPFNITSSSGLTLHCFRYRIAGARHAGSAGCGARNSRNDALPFSNVPNGRTHFSQVTLGEMLSVNVV
jgi:hypothetical protein